MKCLVLGGAGYVGSHFVAEARRQGHHVVVADNLVRGHRGAVPDEVEFKYLDVRDQAAVEATIHDEKPDVVLHYAAYALVGESVQDPERYRDNNVEGTRAVLQAIERVYPETGLPVVFSSTCAVYGEPEALPITEEEKKAPVSPYGETKLACERLLEDYASRVASGAVALRYFNACGADRGGTLGEDHEPETHLIPNVLKAIRDEREFVIFGQDFATEDGTCVRDYIHVTDLADAHLAAAEKMVSGELSDFTAVNLGTGTGYSNLEVLRAAERATGKAAVWRYGDRRPGDPPRLFADCRKAEKVLGFTATRSSLENILATAWRWHRDHPDGFST